MTKKVKDEYYEHQSKFTMQINKSVLGSLIKLMFFVTMQLKT